jgi:uncharacterized membrane protein
MNTIQWWKSKTLWLNIIATAITLVQALQGSAWINPEYQVFILAALNAILRLFTGMPIANTPGARPNYR